MTLERPIAAARARGDQRRVAAEALVYVALVVGVGRAQLLFGAEEDAAAVGRVAAVGDVERAVPAARNERRAAVRVLVDVVAGTGRDVADAAVGVGVRGHQRL